MAQGDLLIFFAFNHNYTWHRLDTVKHFCARYDWNVSSWTSVGQKIPSEESNNVLLSVAPRANRKTSWLRGKSQKFTKKKRKSSRKNVTFVFWVKRQDTRNKSALYISLPQSVCVVFLLFFLQTTHWSNETQSCWFHADRPSWLHVDVYVHNCPTFFPPSFPLKDQVSQNCAANDAKSHRSNFILWKYTIGPQRFALSEESCSFRTSMLDLVYFGGINTISVML